MREGTLEFHAVRAGTGAANEVAVKEVEVVVASLVDGDELFSTEALTAAGALLLGSFSGGDFGGLLSYTECVHSLPPNG
jgi:hypothetical protein